MLKSAAQKLFVLVVVGTCQSVHGIEPLNYKMRPGEAFAYDIHVSWNHNGKEHRLSGRPYYQVHHRNGDSGIVMVIGRLQHHYQDDGKWKRNSTGDYWFGTELVVGRHAATDAMQGQGGEHCPRKLVGTMLDMTFPRIPYNDEDSIHTGGTTKTMELKFNGLGAGEGKMHRGRSDRQTKTRKLGGNLVEFRTDNNYRRDDGSKRNQFQALAVFDNNIGKIAKKRAIAREDKDGSRYEVRFQSRLIQSGKELAAAKAQAAEDYQHLPSDMIPLRFFRQRVKADHMPERYSTNRLPPKGTIVGFYTDNETYAAKFLHVLDRRDVEIELLGSGERRKIHPGLMVKLTKRGAGGSRSRARNADR